MPARIPQGSSEGERITLPGSSRRLWLALAVASATAVALASCLVWMLR